jgi:GT2 family glycosyltransferase
MDKRSLVGVVTVTFNSASVIRGFLQSVFKQAHTDFILYIVDNSSSDDTLKLLAEYQDSRIVPIPNRTNVGVAEGNNIGIRAALNDGCGSVLLLNNDTEFDSDLLAELVEGVEQFQCEMAVPKILYFDQPDKIWCAGGYFSGYRGSARHFGSDHKDDGSFDQPRAVNYSPTCCMLIKKEVFERVGFMDANYFVYFDDTDFCNRAHRSGVKLFYIPSARLLHKVSSLTGSESDFTYRYCIRNHVYYLLKNFPRWQLAYYLPALQFHIFMKFVILLRNGRAFAVAQSAFVEGFSLFVSRFKHERSLEIAQVN